VSLSEMAGEPSCAWKSLSPGALASGQIPMRKMEASTKGHPITRLTSRFISALLLRFIHCFDLPAIRAPRCVSRGRRA
jgi:hypothetical protein